MVERVDSITKVFPCLIKLNQMKLVSDMQEENDRKGLGLYGFFEDDQRQSMASTVDEKPFININNTCYSCSQD